jgi:hypothetical protein
VIYGSRPIQVRIVPMDGQVATRSRKSAGTGADLGGGLPASAAASQP